MADRIDILLKEYETCQAHNNAIGSQFWVSISITMSINAVLLGGLIYSAISSGPTLNPTVKCLVLILGVGIILILLLVMTWLKRLQFMTLINNERMREIEDLLVIDDELVMWKNWRVYGLDEKSHGKFFKLSAKRQKKINELSECYKSRWYWWLPWPFRSYIPPIGSYIVLIMFGMVIILWIFSIVVVF